MVSRDEASAMTVAVLKAKLQELGLATTGKKEELVTRYVEATSSEVVEGTVEEEAKIEVPAAPSEPEAVEDVDDGANVDAAPSAGGKKIVFPVKEVSLASARSEHLSI